MRIVRWLVAGGMLVLGGCVSVADVERLREDSVAMRETLREQREELERRLEVLPEDDPAREGIRKGIESSRTVEESLEAGVREVDRAMAAVNNPAGIPPGEESTVGVVAGTVATVLPPQWRMPLILGGALLGALARARQLRVSMASVVKSIELAKREDEQFRVRFHENSAAIRSVQTPLARRLVDQSQAARPGLALPI